MQSSVVNKSGTGRVLKTNWITKQVGWRGERKVTEQYVFEQPAWRRTDAKSYEAKDSLI